MQLNNKMCGFYRAKAMLDGKEEYMAVTQHEPTDCRRTMPCFYEPALKATFDVTLIGPCFPLVQPCHYFRLGFLRWHGYTLRPLWHLRKWRPLANSSDRRDASRRASIDPQSIPSARQRLTEVFVQLVALYYREKPSP